MGASADEGVVGNLSELAGRGYTVLPGLLEPTVADSLRDELDQMLESHADLSAGEGDGEFRGRRHATCLRPARSDPGT